MIRFLYANQIPTEMPKVMLPWPRDERQHDTTPHGSKTTRSGMMHVPKWMRRGHKAISVHLVHSCIERGNVFLIKIQWKTPVYLILPHRLWNSNDFVSCSAYYSCRLRSCRVAFQATATVMRFPYANQIPTEIPMGRQSWIHKIN